MLQAIHDRVTGWIAWIIVGLIGITFALWGIDSYLRDEAKVYAAAVNDVEISIPEYRFAKQQQTQRLRSMLGERYDANITNTTEFKTAVLNRLIEEELFVQAATAAGMAVSDGFLAARIHAIADFQQDGEFSNERYQRLLQQQGLTPPRFEQQFRRALLINQLVGGISNTAVVIPQDIEQGLRLQGQERKLRFVRIPLTRFLDNAQVTPEEIEAFYAENKSRFVEPEQVRLQYLELSLATLGTDLEASEEDIQRLYETEKARLGGDEQRRVRHILLQVDEGADDEAWTKAQQQAEELIKRLHAGEDFAALAKEFSQDPGSASAGGDLGLFGKGMMVPEFETAAFALDKDVISGPVRSPFGIHIMQVTEIQTPTMPTLDEVRDQLKSEAAQQRGEELFFEKAETLGTLTFEHPDTLSLAAEQLGLKVQESAWLTAVGGEGIGAYPKVVEAAFEDDVLTASNNSQVIEIKPNHVVVVRVLEHRPSKQLELDVVREAIGTSLRGQNARKAAAEEGAKLVERLRAGAPLDTLASELGLEMKDAGFVSRDNGTYDRQIVAAAFRIARGSDGKIATAGASLSNGDYALIQIDEVRDADVSGVGEDVRAAFSRNLDQLYGNLEIAALLADLKSKAEIEQNLDRLD